MSHWNYRIVRETTEAYSDPIYTIREAHYDHFGGPVVGVSVSPATLLYLEGEPGTPQSSLATQLDQLRAALDKPILDADTLKELP